MKASKGIVLSSCLGMIIAGWVQAQPTAAEPKEAPVAATPGAPPDPMALLKELPADVTAFVAIPNLALVDAHVKGVVQQLGLTGIVPNPLDWLKTSTGVSKGLNENGSVGFAVLSLKDAKSPEDIGDRLVLYIPTANSEELLKTLGAEKDGDVSKVTLMGQPSVAAATKGFVIAAEKPEAVKAALKATKKGLDGVMSPERIKAYASQDVFVWADPRTLSKELRTQLRDALTNMMGKMNPAAAAAQKNPGVEQMDKMFDDIQEFTVGVSLDSKRGLAISWFASPREGSEMAAQMKSYKGEEGTLLAGLPKEPVVAAMGVSGMGGDASKNQQMDQVFTQVLTAYTTALSSAGIELEKDKLMALKEPLIGLFTTMDRFAVSIAGLPAGSPDGRVGIAMVAKVADSQKWQASAHKLFGSLKDLIIETAKKHGESDEKIKPISDAIQWKAKAEQVEGATVDQLFVDLDKLPKPSESEQASFEKFKQYIGKEGPLIRIAALADNHVVVTFGGGPKRFNEILELAKKDDKGLSESPTIRSVANRLPKGPRVVEGYLALDNLLDLVMTSAAQFGSPIPMPLALRNAAPLTLVATKVTPTASETLVLVPIELMVSVKDLVPMMMMMGGGGGGLAPPGGNAPEPPNSGLK